MFTTLILGTLPEVYTRVMLLHDLLKNITTKEIIGSLDKEIISLSQDSRDQTFKEVLYFAVPGTEVDGHSFIDEVIPKGGTVIVCEHVPEYIDDMVTYVVVENSRKTVGEIANTFYGNPSHELKVVAVTGTNGKTTIASYTSQALQCLGEKTLLLSTAGDYFNGELISLDRKAPSSLETIELHKILRKYRNQGATYVCLEATSQGLDQDRLSGIDIGVAIFTNIEQDHLDYHKTIDHYVSSKKLLFDNLKESGIAISNYDDDYGSFIIKDTLAKVISYGSQVSYDYFFVMNLVRLGSIDVDFNNIKLTLPVIGKFNIYNVMSVYTVLIELGYNQQAVIKTLENLTGVPGRMEQIENNKDVLALVDYAHSPGALENVLETLQALPHNNIITIIGCGGDRDKTKRAPMASVTQRLSNTVIYTSDNPRTEDLDQIFNDMKEGVDTSHENYKFINNREEAIKYAVDQAQSRDIVLVAGKGHEDYQIIGTQKQHFDDREVLEKYL